MKLFSLYLQRSIQLEEAVVAVKLATQKEINLIVREMMGMAVIVVTNHTIRHRTVTVEVRDLNAHLAANIRITMVMT